MGAWVRRALSCAAIGPLWAGCLDAPAPPVGVGGGDGGGGDCGGLGVLSDVFDAEGPGDALGDWEMSGEVAVTGDALEMAGGGGRAVVSSREWVLPRGALVVGPVMVAPGSSFELVVTDGGGSFARIATDGGGTLRFEADGEVVAAVDYAQAEQAFWRVELRRDEVSFATSADAAGWDARGAAPLAMDGLIQVSLSLAAGEGAMAEIGGVNPNGAAERCPLADLVDTFDSDTGAWLEEFDDKCAARIDQRLEVDHPGFQVTCLVRSARRYRMDGDALSVVPVQVPPGGVPSVDVFLRAPDGHRAGLHLHEDDGVPTLECRWISPGAEAVERSYVAWQAEAMARWRLRRVPGGSRIVCEAEALDGTSPIVIGEVDGTAFDDVEVVLGTDEDSPAPVTVAFDDVNAP